MRVCKKIIAVFLCLVLCVSIMVSSASAAAASATVTLSSSGTGAIAAGSGELVQGALPLLSYIAAAGVSIYSVNGIITELTRMYEMLSQEIKDELIAIAESGDTSYILTKTLADALATAYDQTFYDANGTFRTYGLTFDSSAMLAYNYDAQYYYGSTYPTSTCCETLLGSDPVEIPGTALTACLTDCPGDYGGKWLTINNPTSGIEVSMIHGTMYDWLNMDCCNYYISSPTVISTYAGNDVVGYWILKECASLAAENGSCGDCYATYITAYVSMNPDTIVGGYAMVTGTGDANIDGKILTDQTENGINDWSWIAEDGSVCAKVPVDIGSSAVCDGVPYTIAYTDADELVEGDTLYVATDEVCEDVNLMTQTFATTGEITETETPDDTTSDVDVGTLGDFFRKVWEGGLSLAEAIRDFFGDFFDDVGSTITNFFNNVGEAIKGLFADDDSGGLGGFFEFMRNLWNCFPVEITKYFIFVFGVITLIGIMKMFW